MEQSYNKKLSLKQPVRAAEYKEKIYEELEFGATVGNKYQEAKLRSNGQDCMVKIVPK